MTETDNLIEVKSLQMHYKQHTGFMEKPSEKVYALNGIDLNIKKGEILGLVGESGCGKSTLGRCVLNLQTATSGEVMFKGENIFAFSTKQTKLFRRDAQMVFQNPYSSLNPKMRVYDILMEPLLVHRLHSSKERMETVYEVLELVGLNKEILNRYPHEFSGGQKQRIAIARSLVLKPEFIVADEPVSALDVSIQAQIINLLTDLREKLNLTILFISHDLSVIKYVSDRVAVMYLGEIVELSTKAELFRSPEHPYTKALLKSIPTIEKKEGTKILLEGDLPNPSCLPSGCKFHTRCSVVQDVCFCEVPQNIYLSESHYAKCLFVEPNKPQ